jgi:hypothetical protein
VTYEGSFYVEQNSKSDSIKIIRYKAEISPELHPTQRPSLQNPFTISPAEINLNQLLVHTNFTTTLTIHNNTPKDENFWISSDSDMNTNITTDISEGTIQGNQLHTFRFDDTLCMIQTGMTQKPAQAFNYNSISSPHSRLVTSSKARWLAVNNYVSF